MEIDLAPSRWPTKKVSAERSSPGAPDSTCLSRKQGLRFSIHATCSALSSIFFFASFSSSLSQRS